MDSRCRSRRRFLALGAGLAAGLGTSSTWAAPASRRIGFVDDDLNNYHSNIYLDILRKELRPRGFVVAGATALKAESGRRWAREHGVPYFETVEQLGREVDFFCILAPASPQVHWELCRRVFPLGKTTFVDKTFAPDTATARRIFALADKHRVAVQTSSALRYTPAQRWVKQVGRRQVRHVVTWGTGSNLEEYLVHPLEMAISCLGPGVESLMRRGSDRLVQLLLNYPGDRTAVVNLFLRTRTPFAAAVTTEKETRHFRVSGRQLFVDAAAAMLDFFQAGRALVPRAETLDVMRCLDAARTPDARRRFVPLAEFSSE